MREGPGGEPPRTPETLAGLAVFKTAAFNHSAIPPSSIRLAATLLSASR